MSHSKYGAVPTVVDGIRFASKAEAHRYQELKLLERGGRIRGLKLQPRYKLYALVINGPPADGKEVCVYVADFEYEEDQQDARDEGYPYWVPITEDTKGMETPVFKLKAKFFAACYGREVRITK